VSNLTAAMRALAAECLSVSEDINDHGDGAFVFTDVYLGTLIGHCEAAIALQDARPAAAGEASVTSHKITLETTLNPQAV